MSRKSTIYTPKSLAAELQIPIRAVLRAIRRGELRCARFSSCIYRIEGGDADAWIETLKKP